MATLVIALFAPRIYITASTMGCIQMTEINCQSQAYNVIDRATGRDMSDGLL